MMNGNFTKINTNSDIIEIDEINEIDEIDFVNIENNNVEIVIKDDENEIKKKKEIYKMSFLAVIPLIQILWGIIYFNSIKHCNSFISIPIWLIINGIARIISCIIILNLLSINDNKNTNIINIFKYFIYISRLAWMICGSIIFWRDCIHLSPESINILMYISLTVGYVGLGIQFRYY